jgi:putative redox protein
LLETSSKPDRHLSIRRYRVEVKVRLDWDGDVRFVGENEQEAKVTLEPGQAHGGSGKYHTPMELLLVGLGGCAGIDVVLILQKMRVKLGAFSIEIVGRRRAEEPRYYEAIRILYKVSGEGLTEDKARRAAELATEKYCSVGVMLREKAEITFDVVVE